MPRHDGLPAFSDDFAGRIRIELWSLYLVFRFHDKNNHVRKGVTLMAVSVWAVLEIAIAFEQARVPESLTWLRLFVGLLLARMWNIEISSFTNTTLNGMDRTKDDEE